MKNIDLSEESLEQKVESLEEEVKALRQKVRDLSNIIDNLKAKGSSGSRLTKDSKVFPEIDPSDSWYTDHGHGD